MSGSRVVLASASPRRRDLLNLIGHGKIHIKPNVSELAGSVVRFEDGSEEPVDVILYATGYDIDDFDAVCDHLIVEHPGSGKVVGTYRLQTGVVASANVGYYSEREFDFTPYKRLGDSVIELGRACVHRDHRSTEVLYLLWRGIAQYAIHNGGRYLIGCSSLTSQDPAHGTAVYQAMREYLVEPQLRTAPQPAFAMPLMGPQNASDKIPKLLRAYLSVGAKICGPPAIDCEFKTIDFLTLMDLEALHPRVRARFLRA